MALTAPNLVNFQNGNESYSTSDEGVTQICRVTQIVITKKQENIESAIASTKGKYLPKSMQEMTMIGGDVFNAGYLAFDAVKGFFPSIGTTPGVVGLTTSFGIVGGVFNLGAAITCAYEATQAFNIGDNAKGYRLAYDAFFLGMLGVFMIVVSVSSPASPLILFLDTYRWILPLLWFAVSGPTFGEILWGLQKIWRKVDIVSSLKLDELSSKLETNSLGWRDHFNDTMLDVANLIGKSEAEIAQSLSDKIEDIQAEWGPEVAVSLIELLNLMLSNKSNIDAIQQKITDVKHLRDFWHTALRVRLFQHILFTIAFVVSMGTLQLDEAKKRKIEAGVNAFMSLGNWIPTYMDTKWFFARNTTKIVSKVEVDSLNFEGSL